MKKRTKQNKPTKKRHVWRSGEWPGVPYGEEVTLIDVLGLLPIEVLEIMTDLQGNPILLPGYEKYKEKKG